MEDKEKFKEPSTGFLKWLDNFWYHYKAQTIIALVVIVTVVISTVQILTKTNYDYHILYAGEKLISMQQSIYIQNAFCEVADDYNGDGEVHVALNDIVMLSPEQREAAKDDGAVFNNEALRNTMIEYEQQIIAGDAVIFMLSPYMYEYVKDDGAFLPLSEVLPGGSIPECAYDEYAIRLSETDFYKSHNGVDDLPEDTLLVIRRESTMKYLKGAKKTEKMHAACVELFRRLVDYSSEATD